MPRYVNHELCSRCWNVLNPERTAIAIEKEFAKVEKCCRYGAVNSDSIYFRGTSDQFCHCDHKEDD
jgi:hypothetical protein